MTNFLKKLLAWVWVGIAAFFMAFGVSQGSWTGSALFLVSILVALPLFWKRHPSDKLSGSHRLMVCIGAVFVGFIAIGITNWNSPEATKIRVEAEASAKVAAADEEALLAEAVLSEQQVNESSNQAALEAAAEAQTNREKAAVVSRPSVGSSSNNLRNLCYSGVNTNLPAGVTVGEFLDRGKQRGYFKNVLITGHTVRFRVPSNNDLEVKIITLKFSKGEAEPHCTAPNSAVPTGGKINFETLNNANLYVLIAMLEAMAFSDAVVPLTN